MKRGWSGFGCWKNGKSQRDKPEEKEEAALLLYLYVISECSSLLQARKSDTSLAAGRVFGSICQG